MEATCTRKKLARYPDGKGGLYIVCPCVPNGTMVPVYPGMAPMIAGVVCSECGTHYTHEGWIVDPQPRTGYQR